MMLYHVVAMADGRVIGKDNKLPWHFSSDLKHFKQLTMGSTVIMGRKTFESIGKPLPGRENFVLTRHPETPFTRHSEPRRGEESRSFVPQKYAGLRMTENIRFFSSLEDALAHVTTSDCYIIGGESLYRQTIDRVDGIYLTQIEGRYEGDTFYPELPAPFKEKSRQLLQDNPKIEVIYYEKQKE